MFEVKRTKIADMQLKTYKDLEYIVIILNKYRKGYQDKQTKYSMAFYVYGKKREFVKDNFKVGDVINIKFRISSKIFIDKISTSLIAEFIEHWKKKEYSEEQRKYYAHNQKFN